MAKKSKFFDLVFFILFLITPKISEGNTLVVINEIAWMGRSDPNDEWLELYNPTNLSVDISGWKLVAKDGTPNINLEGKISPNNFFILERTDDNTLPEVLADQIYKGALSNNGEYLELFDKNGNLIDFLDCSLGWFAGDNQEKFTMERIDPYGPGNDFHNWKNSNQSGGTPKLKNSPIVEIAKKEENNASLQEDKEKKIAGEEIGSLTEGLKGLNILSVSFLIASISAIFILFLKQKI